MTEKPKSIYKNGLRWNLLPKEVYGKEMYVPCNSPFHYWSLGIKGDLMTEKRDYSLCIDCRHQRGTWISDREVDTWCAIIIGVDCDEVFECSDFME